MSSLAVKLVTRFYLVNLLLGKALGLSCNHCSSDIGWESCDRDVAVGQCDALLVNDLHLKLHELNPSLPLVVPYWSVAFRCYAIELQLQDAEDKFFERGCTYQEANFCQNWEPLIVQNVIQCNVSREGVPDAVIPPFEENSSHRMRISCWSALLVAFWIGTLGWLVRG